MDQEYVKSLEARINELEASVRLLKRLVVYRSSENGSGVTSRHDQVLTVNDVIEILGLPRHIIYAKAKSGEIPSFKIGKGHRFSRKKVLEWFEGNFDKAVVVDEFVDKYLQKNHLTG
jgi:excisionase family DNA binding protein